MELHEPSKLAWPLAHGLLVVTGIVENQVNFLPPRGISQHHAFNEGREGLSVESVRFETEVEAWILVKSL
jgi:hypothetical protein